jgi:threonine synthase
MIIPKQLVHETISPSMDISVASNFERLVYDLFLDRDSNKMLENV